MIPSSPHGTDAVEGVTYSTLDIPCCALSSLGIRWAETTGNHLQLTWVKQKWVCFVCLLCFGVCFFI